MVSKKFRHTLKIIHGRSIECSDFVCEFCGMTYPEDLYKRGHPLGYSYRKITVRNVMKPDEGFKTHTVCKDCFDRMEEI